MRSCNDNQHRTSDRTETTYPTQAASAYPAFTNDPCAPAIRPLECGGDTSEKYVGIAVKTWPTDTPVMTRAAKYWITVGHK